MRGSVDMSFDQAPPPRVPLRFMLTAPLWGVVAALLLLYLGPAAFTSRWSPGALALTHAITLGVMAQVMIGALLQLLPVLAAASMPAARRTSMAVHALINLGLVALVGGFLGYTPAFRWAVALLAAGFGWLLPMLMIALWRTTARHASMTAMRLALLALTVTVCLGLLLVTSYLRPEWVLRQYTQLHLLWGLAGWVTLLVAGVAYQVVPMFQLTAEYPLRLRKWLAPAVFALLLGVTAATVLEQPVALRLALLALMFLLGLFALATLHLQARRRRRLPDVTLQDWRYGLLCGLAVIGLVMLGEVIPGVAALPGMALTIGTLGLLGFAVTLIVGMLYKIVPFLLWLDLQRLATGSAARKLLPSMKTLVSDASALWQSRAHWLAVVLLSVAVYLPWLLRPAALVLALSFAWLFHNLMTALRLHATTREAMARA